MAFRLSRRFVLRGAGAAIALPTLEAMLNAHGTAFAQGQQFPKRYVVWFFGNGVNLPRWRPAAQGQGAAWQLSEQLQPLAAHKEQLTVVTGCNIRIPSRRGHHDGVAAMMSGAEIFPLPAGNAPYASRLTQRSLDQDLADVIGTQNRFKSLQLRVSKRVVRGEGPTLAFLSHASPTAPLEAVENPVTLFNQLFTGVMNSPNDPRNTLRTNVLDAVRDETRALHTKLGATDRARLDQHLTGIAELRQRVQALPVTPTGSCRVPTAPTQTNADVNGQEQIEAVNRVMSDLMAMAFACDLTRVATFQFSGSVGFHTFNWLGTGPRASEHALTHDQNEQGKVHDSVVFSMRCFAQTLASMKAITEGGLTVLDRSAVLCTSDVAEGFTHSGNDYPILVAGSAGGALRTNMHYRAANGRNTSDLLLALMQAVGGTTFTGVGAGTGRSTTPMREIMTS
ncbi:MAG: DUF1552 domain-containing protein [Myxococcaceae bacterium]|nr:DUF1552 domain-containing protein [Myxococcaceae bacterium]